jgi:LPS-assembly protein
VKNGKQSTILFIIIILFVLVPANAAKNGTKQQPKLIIKAADKKEISFDRFIASGNVEVQWGEYRLYADYLEFNRKTKELLARGRITMSSKETVVTGERFRFNTREKSGEMYETYGQLSPTTRYTSDKLTHVDNDTFTFNKMDFTPCAQCKPRWKISCANGKIKKEKYIEMKHLLFKVKDIPIFYWPYMRYPINENGRATGFLMPVAGSSNKAGLYVLNGFYWAIKPNIDLTLNFDYYTRAGRGYAQEFRYLTPRMGGNVQFYLFNYNNDFTFQSDQAEENEEASTNPLSTWAPRKYDYFFKMKHLQQIPLFNTKTQFTIDIDKQSDPNFMRLLGGSLEAVSNRTFRSSIALTSSFKNLKLSMITSQNDTFNAAKNSTVQYRYLPKLQANLNQQKLGKLPGYFSLAMSYSAIQKREISYSQELETSTATSIETDASLEPAPDLMSGRFNITPSYTLSLIKAPWLSANLSLKSSHSFYDSSRDLEEEENIVAIDDPLSLDYQTASMTLKGPIFSRIFDFKTSKLKHLIEPKFTIRYAKNADQDSMNRLIVMDSLDYYTSIYSYAEFSLGTRLLFKSKPNTDSSQKKSSSAREILSYTIKQQYYFDPVIANRNRTINDIYPEFSQLSNTLRLKPIDKFSLDATIYYNHYLKRFTSYLITLGYEDETSPIFGDFKYYKNISPYNYNSEISTTETGTIIDGTESTILTNNWRESIGGSVNIKIPGFPVKLYSRVDYDIQLNKFLDRSLSLSFDYQCITFNTGLRIFESYGETQTRFEFGFSFGTLGTVKNMLGR